MALDEFRVYHVAVTEVEERTELAFPNNVQTQQPVLRLGRRGFHTVLPPPHIKGAHNIYVPTHVCTIPEYRGSKCSRLLKSTDLNYLCIGRRPVTILHFLRSRYGRAAQANQEQAKRDAHI